MTTMLSTPRDSLIQSGSYQEVEPKWRRPARMTKRLILATMTACLGPVAFGFVLGYPNPTQDDLKHEMGWNDDQLTWFTSFSPLAAMLGALIGLYTIDKFGRKFNMMMCSLPFALGWAMIAAAKTTSLIYIGRFITGAAMGAISLTVPLYIAEISPAKFRGALCSMNQLGVTIGCLLAYSLGAGIRWRWLAIAGAVPTTIMAVLMFFFPESPRYLFKNGWISEACQSLAFLRESTYEECEEECKEIESTLETDDEPVSLSEFKKPTIYRPLIIAIMLMLFQQFGGINSVITYSAQMLKEAGMSDEKLAAISVAGMQFVGTAVSCLIIDKLGRRILLIFPTILMVISMIVLGAASYFNGFPNIVTLLALCFYIIGFSMGLGPIPWTAMSEIFPTKVRGIASGIATQVNWFGAFTVIKTFESMKDTMHPYGCYWFYAAVCFACVVYVYIFLPETKGKTLEDIERLFTNRRDLECNGQYNSLRT